LCWDGSDGARRAIQKAAGILGDGRQALVLFVHVPVEGSRGVLTGTGGPDAAVVGLADAQDQLEAGVRVASEAGFQARGKRIEADRKTGELIVEAAEEADAPVIVMGQRGRSGLAVAMLGSVSRDVVGAFHRPVLLIGETAAEAS